MKPISLGPMQEHEADRVSVVLSRKEVQLIFETAFRRNVAAVVTSTVGQDIDFDKVADEEEDTSAGSLRGDWRKGLLYHLLSRTTIYDLLARLSQVQKNRFQGSANFHDLALAQCILEIHLHASEMKEGSRIRKSSVATSGMALGRVIDALRKLHHAILNDPQGILPSLWREEDISARFPNLYQAVTAKLEEARSVASKSKLLEKSCLSLSSLLGAFTILTEYGCDEFCADHFLQVKKR